jgi:hypothetical protein
MNLEILFLLFHKVSVLRWIESYLSANEEHEVSFHFEFIYDKLLAPLLILKNKPEFQFLVPNALNVRFV